MRKKFISEFKLVMGKDNRLWLLSGLSHWQTGGAYC